MPRVKLDGYLCLRCQHTWLPRGTGSTPEPRVCPKCKSPYWDTPRRDEKPLSKGKARK